MQSAAGGSAPGLGTRISSDRYGKERQQANNRHCRRHEVASKAQAVHLLPYSSLQAEDLARRVLQGTKLGSGIWPLPLSQLSNQGMSRQSSAPAGKPMIPATLSTQPAGGNASRCRQAGAVTLPRGFCLSQNGSADAQILKYHCHCKDTDIWDN